MTQNKCKTHRFTLYY